MSLEKSSAIDLRQNSNLYNYEEERSSFATESTNAVTSQNISFEDYGSLGIIILTAMTLAGVAAWLQLIKIKKLLKNYETLESISHHKYNNDVPLIPCQKCQFFNDNSYLKCAVNPSRVLQPEAKDCSDYSP